MFENGPNPVSNKLSVCFYEVIVFICTPPSLEGRGNVAKNKLILQKITGSEKGGVRSGCKQRILHIIEFTPEKNGAIFIIFICL